MDSPLNTVLLPEVSLTWEAKGASLDYFGKYASSLSLALLNVSETGVFVFDKTVTCFQL